MGAFEAATLPGAIRAALAEIQLDEHELTIAVHRGARIYPAQADDAQLSSLHGFHGGAYDAAGGFIAETAVARGGGIPTVYAAASFSSAEPAERLGGRALYAGPLYDHFGHFLLESTARLWPAVTGAFDAILYQTPAGAEYRLPEYQAELFDLLGLSSKIRIVTDPLVVDELVVPMPAFVLGRSVHRRFQRLFGRVRERVGDVGASRRIFVSRSRLRLGVTVGEDEIEDAFAQDGYEIIHPETMRFTEQVRLFASASHVAGIAGSGLHNVLMSRPGTTATYLVRDYETVATFRQIDVANDLRGIYVDALDHSLQRDFPPRSAQGPFLIDVDRILQELRRLGILERGSAERRRSPEEARAQYKSEWHYLNAVHHEARGEHARAQREIRAAIALVPDQAKLLEFAARLDAPARGGTEGALAEEDAGSQGPVQVPVRIMAHLSHRGDVFGKSGIDPGGDAALFEGLAIAPSEGLLEYRVRGPDGTWGEWLPSGSFAGTRGQAAHLTGIAVRVAAATRDSYAVRVFGRFRGEADLVEAADGQDCVAPSDGALCGLKVELTRR